MDPSDELEPPTPFGIELIHGSSEYGGSGFVKPTPYGPPPISDEWPNKDSAGRMAASDAIVLATRYDARPPYFIKVMKAKPNSSLYLPSQFGKHLPKAKGKLELHSQGKTWLVTILEGKGGKSHHLTAGWPIFTKENDIRRGDVLIFEYLGNCKVSVIILKVRDPSNGYFKKFTSLLEELGMEYSYSC